MPRSAVTARRGQVRRLGASGPLGRLGRLGIALVATLALLPLWTSTAAAAPATGAPGVAAADDQPQWALPGTDLLSGFERSDHNEQDGTPADVASPEDPSRRALLFTLDGGGERTELEPHVPDQREGQVQYYTYRARLAPDFPTDVDTWQVILQWHHEGDSGSPPVALQVTGGRLVIAAEGQDMQDLGPVRGGELVALTLRIQFSRDPDQGAVDVWRGGDHVLRDYHPEGGTLLDRSDYLKTGIYRDRDIDQTGRLWLEDLRVGPTMASVRSPEQSGAAPVEDDSTASPAGSSSSKDSDALSWLAGGLLVVVVGAGVAAAFRRTPRR